MLLNLPKKVICGIKDIEIIRHHLSGTENCSIDVVKHSET